MHASILKDNTRGKKKRFSTFDTCPSFAFFVSIIVVKHFSLEEMAARYFNHHIIIVIYNFKILHIPIARYSIIDNLFQFYDIIK